MRKLLPVVSLSLLAVPALAQDNFGVLRNVGVTYTSRGGAAAANTNPSVQFCRFDVDRYAGWGVNPANPGNREITGLHFFIQDQDLATQDSFSLVAYTEDPANLGYPNVAAPLATTGNFVLPIGTGAGAYNLTANFANPVSVPSNADLYVGVSQNTAWATGTTDGCSIWATSGNGTAATTDRPGASAPTTAPDNTYGGYFVPSTLVVAYSSSRQFHIEPIIATAAGVASALHYADTLHPAANTAPGTSCMFSAQFPDGANPPLNAGRADDLGMTFVKTGIPDGSLVFWLVEVGSSFAPFEIPVSNFLAGSSGVLCLNLGNYQTVGFSVTASGVATNVLVFPGSARTSLAGLPLMQQAAALDLTTFLITAGPCSLSVY
jgi:hypothetical protein